MASRFGRDPRSTLFSAYDAQQRPKSQSTSPYRANASPYNPSSERSIHSSSNPAFGAYPGSQANGGPNNGSKFRSATPNQKGQYSDAVLNELESQNDAQLEGMSAKVRMLKDITVSIGNEVRDSTALAEKMNDSFEGTRVRLRGTMNRMLRMAERSGIPWKVWLLFFLAVIVLFWWVRR